MKVSEFPSKLLLLYYVLCQFSSSFGYKVEDQFDALKYLARFGYIEPSTMNDMNMVEAKPYLMKFQSMVGIKQTGRLDKKTMDMMNMPRCGNMDLKEPMNSKQGHIRAKRFFINGPSWEKRELTYRITRYSESMTADRNSVEADIDKAFRMWQNASNLNFIKASPNQKVDIEIEFSTKHHADSYPFDGPGQTLAHAFGPQRGSFAGDVHFDDHEKWTTNSANGTNVLYVAVHEIGHSLGLGHSKVKRSIMEATYPGYKKDLQLHDDDILGIQALYGPRDTSILPQSRSHPNPPATTTTTERNDVAPRFGTRTLKPLPATRRPFRRANLCEDPKIDASFATDDEIHLLQGDYRYTLDIWGSRGVVKGPTRIQAIYNTIDSPVDACFTRKRTGYTYCFKGRRYWRFSGTKLSQRYPRDMQLNFPGIPFDIDAAFEWPQNGKFYFFKGDKYWVFNPKAKFDLVDPSYPQPIGNLGLNVDSIDSAFVHPLNNRVYIFKDEWYWRLEDANPRVLQTEPPYPRSSRLMWFKCSSYTPELSEI